MRGLRTHGLPKMGRFGVWHVFTMFSAVILGGRSAVALFLLAGFLVLQAGCCTDRRGIDEPLHVLMIGNSFSVSCMRHLPEVASSLGRKLDLASLYIGGCSLEKHWRNCENGDENFRPYRFSRNNLGKKSSVRMNVPAALAMERWDIVTIQQCSQQSWKSESYQPYADNLVALIRKLAPTAEIYIQETWSYTPWDKRLASWKMDQNEMYRRLSFAYAELAAHYSFKVIRTGTAVQEWRKRLPVRYAENSFGGDVVGGRGVLEEKQFKQTDDGRWKPASDAFHLNERGEYFQALVWAAEIFDDDLDSLSYRPSFVDDREAVLMKSIASEIRQCPHN